MTQRLRDWQGRLCACLAERWARPFEWGRQDCALFAADCMLACTGSDPAADLRGTYSDAAGAARIVSAHGGLAAIAEARAGEEVAPQLAQIGDIGLVENAGRDCLAVCAGHGWIVPAADGLATATMESATRAWRLTRREGEPCRR